MSVADKKSGKDKRGGGAKGTPAVTAVSPDATLSTCIVGQRGTPTPATVAFATMDELNATTETAVSDTQPREPEPRRDPAQVVSEVMLAALLSRPELNFKHVRVPGAVICVLVPDAEWLDPVRRAWRREVSGARSTYKANSHTDVDTRTVRTYTFAAGEEPRKSDKDQANDFFAGVMAYGHSAVGFAPEAAWLPSDLVAAIDHEIFLRTPTPDALLEAACRLTECPATIVLTDDEAARVTPRLLRLSVRPGQKADAYLLKLRELLAREAAVVALHVARAPSVRDEPTLDRIHGMDEAVAWGFQLRDDLDAYRKGERAWSDVDKGLLLSGPPGTGKTLFARALATTCGVPLVSGSYGSWLSTGSGFQGDLLKAMRKAFKDAKATAPSILFIDEIDAFADRARVRHYPEWHIEVVNTLLAEIDGVDDRQGVVVIGACNHPDKLDPALVRSGRLDRHIRIGTPSPDAISAILRVHLGEELPGADLGRIGMLLLGTTGADIERIARGARRRARLAGRRMEMADIVGEAGDAEGRSCEDLLLASVHEAGHAVAALVLGFSIVGVALRGASDSEGLTGLRGHTCYFAAADAYDRLVFLLSGRAAEEVVLRRVTSGAGGASNSDLRHATVLAAQTAAEFGLENDHGLAWTPLPDRDADLSASLARDPRLAASVRKRLASAYRDALDLVERRRDAVQTVADRLLERRALRPEEVEEILGGKARRHVSCPEVWDAQLDPWCLVPLVDCTSILFGYALSHPVTGGLAWLTSSEVLKLDLCENGATTRSGRRYQLGRRFEPLDVGGESEEARLAFELLLAAEFEHMESLREADRLWVTAMKLARHLTVNPPNRTPAALAAFFRQHGDDYVAMRRKAERGA